MSIPTTLGRGLAVALVTVLAFIGLVAVAPVGAAERSGNDPTGDVVYARGDITQFRAIHRSDNVDLRIRTRVGGQPVNNWPNQVSFIRWRINSDSDPAIEYFADLRIKRGVDTVFIGQVRDAANNQLMPGCQAQQYVNDPERLITAVGNEYRYQFLRGCIGAPESFRARATFRWDHGNPNVGPVYTDFAPQGGPTLPVVSG